jgi:F0F1-type ATP synthase membrane subunit a
MMLIVSILTANLVGVLLGEWRGVAQAARRTMQVGVVLMLAAIVILGYANYSTQ